MILKRRIKLQGPGWSDPITVEDVQLRSLSPHGIHGARQIEVSNIDKSSGKTDFYRTMAVGSELIYSNSLVFQGFVLQDEQDWNYQYHIEEWTLDYGESS